MTMRRGARALLLLAVVALTGTTILARSGAGGTPREALDMRGRRVAVPVRAARVVSLAPSMTEIVFALGAGDRLVGVTTYCDFPPAAKTKPRIGGIYTPNLEAILDLRPDLVLATSEGNREEHVRALEDLHLPVFLVRPVDFASVLESIARVGEVLDRAADARRLVADMQARADAIARAVAGARRPRVLYVIWGSPLIVPGRDTLITDLIRRAGGDSITGQEAQPYPLFSVEEVVARDPEWIILGQHGEASVDDRLREWQALTLLPAVRRGHVRPVDGDLVHRPGPRVVDGLDALARIVHPERIP
jgi:iron complex transport system substrate-binding protein